MRNQRYKKSIKKTLYRKLGGCQHCGKGLMGGSRHDPILEVHHYLPRSKGGSEGLHNAVLLCRPCHVAVHNGNIVSPLPFFE